MWLHQVHLVRMECSSMFTRCSYKQLLYSKFFTAHTVVNFAFICRPGLLNSFSWFDFFSGFGSCYFLWSFQQHQWFPIVFHVIKTIVNSKLLSFIDLIQGSISNEKMADSVISLKSFPNLCNQQKLWVLDELINL